MDQEEYDYGYQILEKHSATQSPFSNVSEPKNRRKFADTHELLKKEMFAQSGDVNLGQSISQISEFNIGATLIDYPLDAEGKPKPTVDTTANKPREEGIYDQYIYFDTDAKDSSSDLPGGKLAWSIVVLNQNKPIDNIIEMQIGNFYVPEIATGALFPQYFFFKRVNILVEEMQAQSIFAQDNIRFHFEMDVQAAGIANLLTPASNDAKFIFSKPFRDISVVTFAFRAPIKTLVFPQDIFAFTSVAGTSPARIVTTDPHGIAIAGTVSIFSRDFASNVGNVDALINSVDGHLVTAIDAVTLEFAAIGVVGFDFVGVGAVPGNLTIGFRRVAFTMRFRSVTDGKTNRIVPV